MNSLKKYLESIRQYSFPKTRAMEQELDAVRKAHAAVSADLVKVQENLQLTHEGDAQLLADLQQQLRQIESEHSNAREWVESLEHSITEAEQRQKSTEGHTATLEKRLEEERRSARERVESLEHSIVEAEQRQKSTEGHTATLETRLDEERRSARERVESLERALADAGLRQKSIEGHTAALEARLEEERSRHEASKHATETFLARMQEEQQSHLKRIPELENNIQGVATHLQESLQSESRKTQHSQLKLMVIFGVLFATGTLAGAFIIHALQDRKEELAVVKQDIREMDVFMKQHLDNQDTVLNQLALALDRQATSEPAPIEKASLAHAAETPEADKQPQKTVAFTPDIRELQASLVVLGFDLGISKLNGELDIKTRQALQEFRQFYLPDSDSQDDVVTEPLAALILKSADRARVDAARFRIGSDVLAAIRLGSIRTGVDFSFLMEMARVESTFSPTVRAPKSSATGLFQFRDSAWLESIRAFGADYSLEDYATRVKLIDSNEHEQQPIVRDPLQLEVLALRLNPRLSALMAAENIKRNLQTLSARTGHAPGRTDLYLAHYLGPDAAVLFLKTLDEEPATIASDIFPKQAAMNPGVFQNRKRQPRTVAGVYRWFDSKFNTVRYDERNPV